MRSGEKARWKSRPAARPDSSSSGPKRSRVVPGYVVDSSTTSWPAWSTLASAVPVSISGWRSGSRLSVRGVGTATTTASTFARSA